MQSYLAPTYLAPSAVIEPSVPPFPPSISLSSLCVAGTACLMRSSWYYYVSMHLNTVYTSLPTIYQKTYFREKNYLNVFNNF
jgi:hypothetical protein